MKFQPFLALAGAMVLSFAVPLTYATEPGSDQERIQQQSGSEKSVPADQESTKKQRNPAKDQHADQNAQVTLGGAKSVVSGEIRRIEGEYFFVKDDESGDEARLLVNKNTNLDCSAASTQGPSSQAGISKQQSSEQQSPEASKRQREQGQKKDETAMGSGFTIGSCSFNSGDKIRAEVDDNGRVTMLKFLSDTKKPASQSARPAESAGTGELAMPGKQDKPGQLDMTTSQGYPPKQYAILPVPLGEFKAVREHALLHRPVKNPDGKTVGTLESLIMDSDTGKVEYAVVSIKGTKELQAVPWSHFTIKRENKELVLNTKGYQLSPDLTKKEMEDRSPEIDKLIKDMEHAIAAADLREDSHQKIAAPHRSGKGPSGPPKDVKGEVVRGRVLKIEGESLFVKEKSGKEVRMLVDRRTQKGTVNIKDEAFKVGDKVEAYVTPDGHAFSISLMRAQGGIPGDPDAGG